MVGEGSLIDGKYLVLSEIGRGGMSVVWLSRDVRLNKLWAVKEVGRSALGADGIPVVQTLVREAELLKGLDHPALPRIVDIVEDEDSVVVVMDYVEGESLASVLRSARGGLPESDVIRWGEDLCDVLSYLHAQEPPIVYRDMKPSNIMLTPRGDVRLIDFGIARRYDLGASGDTRVLGTRGYAAPEQFSATSQTDARTDVFGLGMTLRCLVTGTCPSDWSLGRTSIRDWDASLSEGLDQVLTRATQANPALRYQTAKDMAADLRHYRELTREFREGVQNRVRGFALRASLALVLMAGGVGLVAGHVWVRDGDYAALVDRSREESAQAKFGETSPREDLLVRAIETNPGSVEAYSRLIDEVYLSDLSYGEDEVARWSELVSSHRGELSGAEGYADLCYQEGISILSYYDYGQEESSATRALPWFEEAEVAYRNDGDEPAARVASAYRGVCAFYVDVTRSVVEGREGDLYRSVWDDLRAAMADLGPADPIVVRLRVGCLATSLLASPAHSACLWRSGVGRAEVEELLADAERVAVGLALEASQSQLTRELCETLEENVGVGRETVRRTWGEGP